MTPREKITLTALDIIFRSLEPVMTDQLKRDPTVIEIGIYNVCMDASAELSTIKQADEIKDGVDLEPRPLVTIEAAIESACDALRFTDNSYVKTLLEQSILILQAEKREREKLDESKK